VVAGIRRGHVAQLIGEVETYRDRHQLKVSSLRVLPAGTVDARALLPSVGAVDRYWETLDGWRGEIRKPRLKRVLDFFYTDTDFRTRYEQCPASIRGHHAAIGGLLKHTTEVAAIARTIARTSSADPELVLAGVLLHDIGKLESYDWDGLFQYTTAGSLIGHVVLGGLMLERRLSEERPAACTPAERDILLHLILSHHGRREYGSPVLPMTLEAEVLHWADNASAKTASVAAALSEPVHFGEGSVSQPIRSLDHRRLFKGHSDWGAG
jgi:3'-5' exoribonuclease